MELKSASPGALQLAWFTQVTPSWQQWLALHRPPSLPPAARRDWAAPILVWHPSAAAKPWKGSQLNLATSFHAAGTPGSCT